MCIRDRDSAVHFISTQLRPETKIKKYKTILESTVTYGADVRETTDHMRKILLF